MRLKIKNLKRALTAALCLAALDTKAEPISIEGRIDRIITDYENFAKFEETIYLHTENDLVYKLEGIDEANTNDYVRISGDFANDTIFVTGVEKLREGPHFLAQGGKILIAIVDFNDGNLASNTVNYNNLSTTLFGSASSSYSNFIKQASYGHVNFDPDGNGDGKNDIFGPISVDIPTTCDGYKIQAAVDPLLKAQNINLSIYNHISYIVKTNCGWAGVAQVGGGISWLHSNYALNSYLYAHEIGHNFGFLHANTQTGEYADYSDPMGAGWNLVSYNSAHLNQIDWLRDYPQSIVEITEPGTYNLKVLGTAMNDPQNPAIIKIKKTDTNEYYFLSFRQRQGLDASLGAQYLGLNIHTYPITGLRQSYFLKLLPIGQTFEDTANKIYISSTAFDQQGLVATIDIAFDDPPPPPPPCDTNKFSASWIVQETALSTKIPSANLSFKITNENKDINCIINLLPSIPVNTLLKLTLSPKSYNLKGGSSVAFTLNVKKATKKKNKKISLPISVNGYELAPATVTIKK